MAFSLTCSRRFDVRLDGLHLDTFLGGPRWNLAMHRTLRSTEIPQKFVSQDVLRKRPRRFPVTVGTLLSERASIQRGHLSSTSLQGVGSYPSSR